jgi:DNA-binding transcriptional regulator YhcF (GntR family)
MAHQASSVPELVRGDDLPVGANLFWRLQALIRSGHLPANQQLPGIREFAAGAGVNVNTARAIYRRLEGDGLAVSRQGLGTFVSPHAPVSPALEELAARVAAEAAALGIEPRELARALYAGSSAAGLEEASRPLLARTRRNARLGTRFAGRSPASKPSSPHTPR